MTASSMIGRIAAACSILDLPAAAQDQWVECAERWGVRSPPALGCLLALVREAWPECDVSVHHCYGLNGVETVIVIMASDLSDRDDSWEKWDAEGYDDCLVAALEAAPQPAKVTT